MKILAISLFPFFLLAKDPSSKEDLQKISKSMGHMIQENLEELGLDLDINGIIEGMKEAKEGKISPLDEEACFEAIAHLREQKVQGEEIKNLIEAEQFLTNNRVKPNLVLLENGFIQYQVVKKGRGSPLKAYHQPLMRYLVKYADGSIAGKSDEGERVDLDQVISGFKKGVLGMMQGEKRVIYLHPKFAHPEDGLYRPNALLIIEVELLETEPGIPDELADDLIPQHTF